MKSILRDTKNRTPEEHKQECMSLAIITTSARKYWSKIWGINRESCLMKIPHIDLSSILVHDRMEGVMQYEISLLLLHSINDKRFCSLNYLNKIREFPYSYLDKPNKPERIDKNHLIAGKLKQTTTSNMTLCCTAFYHSWQNTLNRQAMGQFYQAC